MTLAMTIVMGTTLVLSVSAWKLGDVFRDWLAVRRLDVQDTIRDVVTTTEIALATANEAKVMAAKVPEHHHSDIHAVLRRHEEELEKLRIRTMRG